LFSQGDNFNVLLFGLAGSGKSSFINSVWTLLSPENSVSTVAAYGGGTSHSTKQLIAYTLPNTRITLWDTWGLAPDTYQQSELESILSGELPSGWEMQRAVSDITNQQFLQELWSSKHKRRIHSVIFFFPQSLMDPNAHKTIAMVRNSWATVNSVGKCLNACACSCFFF